jgi:hypothetical protein
MENDIYIKEREERMNHLEQSDGFFRELLDRGYDVKKITSTNNSHCWEYSFSLINKQGLIVREHLSDSTEIHIKEIVSTICPYLDKFCYFSMGSLISPTSNLLEESQPCSIDEFLKDAATWIATEENMDAESILHSISSIDEFKKLKNLHLYRKKNLVLALFTDILSDKEKSELETLIQNKDYHEWIHLMHRYKNRRSLSIALRKFRSVESLQDFIHTAIQYTQALTEITNRYPGTWEAPCFTYRTCLKIKFV